MEQKGDTANQLLTFVPPLLRSPVNFVLVRQRGVDGFGRLAVVLAE